jgi:hypothetical protein
VYREEEWEGFDEQVIFATKKLEDGTAPMMFQPIKNEQLSTRHMIALQIFEDSTGVNFCECD